LRRRRAGCAALLAAAAATAACAGEGFDPEGLEARYPRLRALAPHPLGSSRPYALPLAGELTLFLCRWPTGEPISVSFAGEPDAAQREALAAALRGWEGAGLGVRFAPGEGPGAIRVRLRDDLVTSQADTVADCRVEGAPPPGATEVPGARIVGASIHVARGDPHLRLTLLHELGHALGFQGHVVRGRTLMLARESEVLARARRVTDSAPVDDAGLRALYAVPSGAIVARVPVARAQTLPADRLQAFAAERGLPGPFARMGDRSGLLWWAGSPGRRLALRVEGALGAPRRPAALRLAPASEEAERLLAPGAARGAGPADAGSG
jgi:hypothetical protein